MFSLSRALHSAVVSLARPLASMASPFLLAMSGLLLAIVCAAAQNATPGPNSDPNLSGSAQPYAERRSG